MKKTLVRGLRKSANIIRKSTEKTAVFMGRVENKTTRIISGTESSVFGTPSVIPFEKLYFTRVPYITPVHPALPQIGRKPSVTLFIPSLNKGSFFGGTATAIITAATLAQKSDKNLRVVQTLKHGKADIKEFLRNMNIPFKNDVEMLDISGRTYNIYGYIDIHPDDIFIASAWWDAHLISKLPLTKPFVYLIQDFEPIFYNNSDLYLLSEATYKLPNYLAICNTKLMYDFMLSRGYNQVKKGTFFEPAVSQKTKDIQIKDSSGQKKVLFLYGRPNVERNLFFTALNAIDSCFSSSQLDSSAWEIFMAGQDGIADIELTSGVVVKNLGKMSFSDYRKFAKTVDVAVSPMLAPHPNYPTLEFASIGAGVVTTKWDIKKDLSSYANNIFACEASVKSISEGIIKAASLSSDSRQKSANSATISDNWTSALASSSDDILKALAN
jgi:O-antigen biosynthesis protein